MTLHSPPTVSRLKSGLILAVFFMFVFNALGLLDFRLLLGGDIAVNRQILDDLMGGGLGAPFKRPDFIVFITIGALLAALLPVLRPIWASFVTLTAMVPPLYVTWVFPIPPPLVPLEYTLLAILILFSVNVLTSYFVETKHRQKIVSAFAQYVPPVLVERISRDPRAFSMAGEAREMSVLFCDIKGFSNISEQLEPGSLADMINHYLTAMTDVLHAHDATIDKYIGDAIMAFWGAPVMQSDHAQRAVTAALEMRNRLVHLHQEFDQRGWPRLEFGIGINSGIMSVGNMGSRYRIAYTVLGDAVNLAARLEGLTRLYGVDILVSDATRAAVPTYDYREIDHVQVKGKGHTSRVFEPLLRGAVALQTLQQESAALNAYYAGDWATAIEQFSKLKDTGVDVLWYAAMLRRMAQHDPPEQWDGVIRFSGELGYTLGAGANATH